QFNYFFLEDIKNLFKSFKFSQSEQILSGRSTSSGIKHSVSSLIISLMKSFFPQLRGLTTISDSLSPNAQTLLDPS
ncbi:MAG: hypothetical protein EZS28_044967, partial [Streblomastix strix]